MEIEIKIPDSLTSYEDVIFWEWRVDDGLGPRLFQDGIPTRDVEEMLQMLRRTIHNIEEITVIGQAIFVTSDPFSTNRNRQHIEFRPVLDSRRPALIEKARKRAREDMLAWASLEHERLSETSIKQLSDVPKEGE